MKYFGLLVLTLVIATGVVEGQTTSTRAAKTCSREQAAAAVPAQVLTDLHAALKLPNLQEASRKAIEIAKKPGSGLKVSVDQRPDGTIVSYVILPAAEIGCVVAMMHFQQEMQ